MAVVWPCMAASKPGGRAVSKSEQEAENLIEQLDSLSIDQPWLKSPHHTRPAQLTA